MNVFLSDESRILGEKFMSCTGLSCVCAQLCLLVVFGFVSELV